MDIIENNKRCYDINLMLKYLQTKNNELNIENQNEFKSLLLINKEILPVETNQYRLGQWNEFSKKNDTNKKLKRNTNTDSETIMDNQEDSYVERIFKHKIRNSLNELDLLPENNINYKEDKPISKIQPQELSIDKISAVAAAAVEAAKQRNKSTQFTKKLDPFAPEFVPHNIVNNNVENEVSSINSNYVESLKTKQQNSENFLSLQNNVINLVKYLNGLWLENFPGEYLKRYNSLFVMPVSELLKSIEPSLKIVKRPRKVQKKLPTELTQPEINSNLLDQEAENESVNNNTPIINTPEIPNVELTDNNNTVNDSNSSNRENLDLSTEILDINNKTELINEMDNTNLSSDNTESSIELNTNSECKNVSTNEEIFMDDWVEYVCPLIPPDEKFFRNLLLALVSESTRYEESLNNPKIKSSGLSLTRLPGEWHRKYGGLFDLKTFQGHCKISNLQEFIESMPELEVVTTAAYVKVFVVPGTAIPSVPSSNLHFLLDAEETTPQSQMRSQCPPPPPPPPPPSINIAPSPTKMCSQKFNILSNSSTIQSNASPISFSFSQYSTPAKYQASNSGNTHKNYQNKLTSSQMALLQKLNNKCMEDFIPEIKQNLGKIETILPTSMITRKQLQQLIFELVVQGCEKQKRRWENGEDLIELEEEEVQSELLKMCKLKEEKKATPGFGADDDDAEDEDDTDESENDENCEVDKLEIRRQKKKEKKDKKRRKKAKLRELERRKYFERAGDLFSENNPIEGKSIEGINNTNDEINEEAFVFSPNSQNATRVSAENSSDFDIKLNGIDLKSTDFKDVQKKFMSKKLILPSLLSHEKLQRRRLEYRTRVVGVLVSSIKTEWSKKYGNEKPLTFYMSYFGIRKMKFLLLDVPNIILTGCGGLMRATTVEHAKEFCKSFRLPPCEISSEFPTFTKTSSSPQFQASYYTNNSKHSLELPSSSTEISHYSYAEDSSTYSSLRNPGKVNSEVSNSLVMSEEYAASPDNNSSVNGSKYASKKSINYNPVVQKTLCESKLGCSSFKYYLIRLLYSLVAKICQEQHAKHLFLVAHGIKSNMDRFSCHNSDFSMENSNEYSISPKTFEEVIQAEIQAKELAKYGVFGIKLCETTEEWQKMYKCDLLPLMKKAGFKRIGDLIDNVTNIHVVGNGGSARCFIALPKNKAMNEVDNSTISNINLSPVNFSGQNNNNHSLNLNANNPIDNNAIIDALKVMQQASAAQIAAVNTLASAYLHQNSTKSNENVFLSQLTRVKTEPPSKNILQPNGSIDQYPKNMWHKDLLNTQQESNFDSNKKSATVQGNNYFQKTSNDIYEQELKISELIKQMSMLTHKEKKENSRNNFLGTCTHPVTSYSGRSFDVLTGNSEVSCPSMNSSAVSVANSSPMSNEESINPYGYYIYDNNAAKINSKNENILSNNNCKKLNYNNSQNYTNINNIAKSDKNTKDFSLDNSVFTRILNQMKTNSNSGKTNMHYKKVNTKIFDLFTSTESVKKRSTDSDIQKIRQIFADHFKAQIMNTANNFQH